MRPDSPAMKKIKIRYKYFSRLVKCFHSKQNSVDFEENYVDIEDDLVQFTPELKMRIVHIAYVREIKCVIPYILQTYDAHVNTVEPRITGLMETDPLFWIIRLCG